MFYILYSPCDRGSNPPPPPKKKKKKKKMIHMQFDPLLHDSVWNAI